MERVFYSALIQTCLLLKALSFFVFDSLEMTGQLEHVRDGSSSDN